MEELGFELDHDSANDNQKQTEYLYHAYECRDADCRLPSCQKMKRRIQHFKSCKQRFNGACAICRPLFSLCSDHAKNCQVAICSVPFCINTKIRFWAQQVRQRLQQARILNRFIATMQNRGISGGVFQSSPENSNSSSQQKIVQEVQIYIDALQNNVLVPNLVNSSSSSQLSFGSHPHASPYRPQPGTAMNPIAFLPDIQRLKDTAKTQVVRNFCDNLQHLLIANFGENYPVVNPPVANTGLIASNQQIETQMQLPVSQLSRLLNSMLNLGNVASRENSGYAQNQQSLQNTHPLPSP